MLIETRKKFFFISFNFQVPSGKNIHEQKQSYKHIYDESSYLVSSLPKEDKQTTSFPWWLQLKSLCLKISPRYSAPKKPQSRYSHYAECHLLQHLILFLKGSVIHLQVNTSAFIPEVLSPEINRTGLWRGGNLLYRIYIVWNLSQIVGN